ncbi:unnamed protein product [Heterobilharzia americana]|nr:unnamed protein product [Heterobilharzia americana]
MKSDVLIDFHLATIKTQMCELQLVGLKEDDPHYSVVMQAIESVRRELGAVTFRLLNAALPTNARHKRLFRTKYVEDVDLRNIENCLVSAANKVVNFNFGQSSMECDLRPAQSSASEFLDTHGRVQALVNNTIELCLTSLSSNHNEYDSAEQKRRSNDSFVHQKNEIQENLDLFDRGSSDSSSVSSNDPPTLLCTASIPPIDSDCSHSSKKPISTLQANRNTISASVQVNIASVIYTTPVKLPSPELLTISPELFHILLELDYYAAQFEFEFVRCVSRRVRTVQEADDVQLVTVLFSETLMWGLTVKLLSVQQLADRDPCVLLALPRLSILVGCRLLPDSPVGANRLATGHRLPFMFSSSRSELAYLCRQLYALRPDQLCRLARWLGPNGLPNLIYHQKLVSKLSYPEERIANSSSEIHNATKVSANITTATTTTTSASTHESCFSLPSVTSGSVPGNLGAYQKSHIWKTYLPGLHRLYKCISGVADKFAREYPTELRFILQKVVEMHDTSGEIDIKSSVSTTDDEESIEEDKITSNSQLSEETELEEEIEINSINMIASEKKIRDLANLFNWTKVMQFDKISSHQSNLNKLFKESSLYFQKCNNKLSYSMDSTGNSSMKSSEFLHKHAVTIPKNIIIKEKAIFHKDIAACLNDDVERICEPHGHMNLKLNSPVNFNQPSTFSQRLQILNLGYPIEGIENPNDSLFNYLPAWQPDFPLYQNNIHQIVKIESDDDNDNDEHRHQIDGDSVSSDDVQDSYIIGHHCATCNRSFTLIRRRHHCRRCGHIFCSKCCNHWQPIEGLASNKPVRICSECHEFLNL